MSEQTGTDMEESEQLDAVTSESLPFDAEMVVQIDADALEFCRRFLTSGLESGELDLPVLPKVAGEILSIVSNPDALMDDLAELIHKDQVVAGYVIKVANRAGHSRGQPIDTLVEAIARLGMKMLGDIAIAITLQGSTFKVKEYTELSTRSMEHSLASGLYSREIARILRCNQEGLFLCGLLHEIGKPAVLKVLSDLFDKYEIKLNVDEIKILMAEFQVPMGTVLAQTWEMPPAVQMAAQYYMNYMDAPTHQEEVRITYLCNCFANFLITPDIMTEEMLRDNEIVQVLGLSEEDMDDLIEAGQEVTTMVRSLRS